MPSFEWILNRLISEETPLALGFAGAMMAFGLWLLVYSVLSRIGLIGTGKVEKKNAELEADRMRMMSENAALAVEKARLEERCVGYEAQIKAMREGYELDLQAEKERSQTLIQRVEEIAQLEQKMKPARRPRSRQRVSDR